MKTSSDYDFEYIKEELREIRGEILDLKTSIDVLRALLTNINYHRRHE